LPYGPQRAAQHHRRHEGDGLRRAVSEPRERGARETFGATRRFKHCKGHWHDLVSNARAVLKHAPTLVEKVRDGFPLNEAYEVAVAWAAAEAEGRCRPKEATGNQTGKIPI
jgi:hypothetical protein